MVAWSARPGDVMWTNHNTRVAYQKKNWENDACPTRPSALGKRKAGGNEEEKICAKGEKLE